MTQGLGDGFLLRGYYSEQSRHSVTNCTKGLATENPSTADWRGRQESVPLTYRLGKDMKDFRQEHARWRTHSSLHLCGNFQKTDFKGGKVYFPHSFRGLSPWSHDTLFWGLFKHARSMFWKRPVYFLAALKRKESSVGPSIPIKGTPQQPNFFALGPSSSSSPLGHRRGTKPSDRSLPARLKFKL